MQWYIYIICLSLLIYQGGKFKHKNNNLNNNIIEVNDEMVDFEKEASLNQLRDIVIKFCA